MNNKCGTEVDLLKSIFVTLDTSQSPITPYGLPVVASEAANIGQYPVAALKDAQSWPIHPPTASFKAALSAGVNTAC